MKNKESFGVTMFGVIFLLLGLYIVNTPIGYLKLYIPRNPLHDYTYQAIDNRISALENESKTSIKDTAALEEFNKKIQEFKNDLQRYRDKYTRPNYIPPSALLLIIIGFVTSVLYIISAATILRLVRLGPAFAIWSVSVGLCMFPLFIWDTYAVLAEITALTGKTIELSKMVIPDYQVAQELTTTLKMIFQSRQGQIFFLTAFIYILYLFVVLWFFNRPKIKHQFL